LYYDAGVFYLLVPSHALSTVTTILTDISFFSFVRPFLTSLNL
jgi:hypothetical protein